MKWTVLAFVLVCCANASRHDAKRLGQVEDAVQYLIREVKELKAALDRQERSGGSIRSHDEAQLARDTLTALQVESRALSQFDVQMRNLQDSLDQLSRNKYQQTQTVEAFRRELQSLREDVDTLKQNNRPVRYPRDAPSDNAVKTLQWLLKSVNQLKDDVNQIGQNVNVQAINQLSDDLRKQTHIMKAELQDLRHKLTEEGLERQKIAVEVTQVRVDFNDLTESHRHLISDLTTLNSQLQLLREDLNVSAEVREWEEHSTRFTRHGHVHKKLHELQTSVELLRDSQAHLESKVSRLQRSSHTSQSTETIEKKLYDIGAKISSFESKFKGNDALLAKLEASHGGIHEHMQMFEEHSDLQSKEIQLLVDQIQHNITQIQVDNELSFQGQEQNREKIIKLLHAVDLIESEMEKDRIAILTLQNKAMNETIYKCKEDTKSQIQDLRIDTLEYQMQTLRLRIDVFNTTMENWNLALSINTFPETKPTHAKRTEDVHEADTKAIVATVEDGSSEELVIVDDCVTNC